MGKTKLAVFLSGMIVALYLILSSMVFGISKADPPVLYEVPTPTPYYVYLPVVVANPASSIPPDNVSNELDIANLINQQRNLNGLPPVGLVSEITQAARRHSRDMADNNFTSHTGSDGSSGGQRMTEAGYNWSTWAEIIGWGWGGNTDSMINWWMNSSGHRAIILTGEFEDFGVGYAINSNSEWGH